MLFIGILFAFFFALLLTSIFFAFFKNTGPWRRSWIFFFIIFMVSFVTGELITPMGPVAWGYYWLPGLFAAILFALLLAASAPRSRQTPSDTGKNTDVQKEITAASYYSTHAPPKGEPIKNNEDEFNEVATLGAFFWIFILMLLITAAIAVIFQ